MKASICSVPAGRVRSCFKKKQKVTQTSSCVAGKLGVSSIISHIYNIQYFNMINARNEASWRKRIVLSFEEKCLAKQREEEEEKRDTGHLRLGRLQTKQVRSRCLYSAVISFCCHEDKTRRMQDESRKQEGLWWQLSKEEGVQCSECPCLRGQRPSSQLQVTCLEA